MPAREFAPANVMEIPAVVPLATSAYQISAVHGVGKLDAFCETALVADTPPMETDVARNDPVLFLAPNPTATSRCGDGVPIAKFFEPNVMVARPVRSVALSVAASVNDCGGGVFLLASSERRIPINVIRNQPGRTASSRVKDDVVAIVGVPPTVTTA